VAKVWQKFHKLSSQTPTLLDRCSPDYDTIAYRGISVTVRLMHAFTKRYCSLFRNARAKSESVQFRCLQKSPTINWLPQQRPFGYCKTYASFIISIHISTNAENLMFLPVVAEIFVGICQFLPPRPKSYSNSPRSLRG